MFIIILWLLLHAKRNYIRKERKKKEKNRYIERGRKGKGEKERNVIPDISRLDLVMI